MKLGHFDAFVIAASVHQEHHQEAVTNFVFAHHDLLSAKPSALISVSLSAALEGHNVDAKRYVDRFVSVTAWQPRMTLLLGGALRFTKYDYFQEQFVKFVVMKNGDPSLERDHEFTDWNALADFADRFLETIANACRPEVCSGSGTTTCIKTKT
ncbi:flavodoxin domain-containing protein [Mesorhizobium australafricanum]|uniref:flavodoxin domain-containing protein n=1 Tax=Mesorhizobium australafricanum TaxID=3072311 RepID=UPI00322162F6